VELETIVSPLDDGQGSDGEEDTVDSSSGRESAGAGAQELQNVIARTEWDPYGFEIDPEYEQQDSAFFAAYQGNNKPHATEIIIIKKLK
jgi:hypothetical protein